jgi:hypothetical protein
MGNLLGATIPLVVAAAMRAPAAAISRYDYQARTEGICIDTRF